MSKGSKMSKFVVRGFLYFALIVLSQVTTAGNINFPVNLDLASGQIDIRGVKLNGLGDEVIVYSGADINLQIFWLHLNTPPESSPAIYIGIDGETQNCFVPEPNDFQGAGFESVSFVAPSTPGEYQIQVIAGNTSSAPSCDEAVNYNSAQAIGTLLVEDPKQLLSKTLVLNDNICGENSYFPSALEKLGYSFIEVNTIAEFENQLSGNTAWDLVLVEEATNLLPNDVLANLESYLDLDGKLFLSHWNWDSPESLSLLDQLGATNPVSRNLPDSINAFNPSTILKDVSSLTIVSSDICDSGQATGFSFDANIGANSLGGYTDTGVDETALILSNDNRSLLFGAKTRQASLPTPDSTDQGLKLAENVIQFFRPLFAFGLDTDNRIFRVDLKTGEEVPYGSISLPTANRSWQSMTLGPNGYVYTLDRNQWTLSTVNESNFNVSLHNLSNIDEPVGVPSLAFHNEQFWIVLDNGPIYSVDSSSFFATQVNTDVGADLIAIASDGNELFGIGFNSGQLHRINTTDGLAELIGGSLPTRKNWSLSADVFGQLWAINEDGEVFSLDKTTGDSIKITNITSDKYIALSIKQAPQPEVIITPTAADIEEFETVILDGTNSVLTSTSEFISWNQIQGQTVELLDVDTSARRNDSTQVMFVAPEVTPDNETLEFELTIHDGKGNIDREKVSVLINNIQVDPIASATAGSNNVADEQTQIILDGSASSDANGEIVSYIWTQLAGPEAEVIEDSSLGEAFLRIRTPEVLERETIRFLLLVTDNDGHTGTTELSIEVVNVANPEFKVEAGVLETFDEGSPVTLTAIVSPKDESFTFTWTQLQGTPVELRGADTDTLTFTAPEVPLIGEELEFGILVTGRGDRRAEDTVTVKIENTIIAPTVSITGVDSTEEKANVTLIATGIDTDGEPLTYRWELTGGAIVSELTGQDSPELTFRAPEVGLNGEVVSFTVTVTDEDGATDSENWQVNIVDVSGTRTVNNTSDAGGGGGVVNPVMLLLGMLFFFRNKKLRNKMITTRDHKN